MGARRLLIESKQRVARAPHAVLEDFGYREDEVLDARIIVEQPTVSLYCLDHPNRRAIFVETRADVDLTEAPFFYAAQHEAATSLIAVPYDTLRRIAADALFDQRRLVLLYSTGRCGSTLVSSAFGVANGVFSCSEPDVYTQLVTLREPDGSNDDAIGDLLRDCTRVMCAAASAGGATAWALKFRSFGIELGDLLFEHFREARVVFLYRDAVGFTRSSARAFRIFEPEPRETTLYRQRLFTRLVPLIRAYSATHDEPLSPLARVVMRWIAVMQRCLDLQQRGVPMFCARYEEIQRAPEATIGAMLRYCGLEVSRPERLAAVLARDSQAGTRLSRENTRDSTSILTEEHIAEIDRLIREHAPELSAGMILPHTYQPETG
jgi:hypothetical protein